MSLSNKVKLIGVKVAKGKFLNDLKEEIAFDKVELHCLASLPRGNDRVHGHGQTVQIYPVKDSVKNATNAISLIDKEVMLELDAVSDGRGGAVRLEVLGFTAAVK